MRTKILYLNQKHKPQSGFTIIEVVVTVAVLGIFLFGFFQTYFALESQRINVARQVHASDIAYSNLRKVTTRPASLTQQTCSNHADVMDMTIGDPDTKPGLDITQFGYTLEPDDDVKKSLGSNATQTLVAYAPAGCSNISTNPIKIVSVVTFGANEDRVMHAIYIK